MSVMYFLIGFSLLIATGFVIAFIWAIRNGQYDDKYTPSVRMLFDDIPMGGDGNAQKLHVLESKEGGKSSTVSQNDGNTQKGSSSDNDKSSQKTRLTKFDDSTKSSKVSRISTTNDTNSAVENKKDSHSLTTNK